MNAHQSTHRSSAVKSSELFFGVLMLIIIFLTSCSTMEASPKVSLESTHIEKTAEFSLNKSEWVNQSKSEFYRESGNLIVPFMIMFLLILSYSALTGGACLVQELKK
ncbi:MAG: hypothetical protein R8G66_15970 [Cytophagales bacterium]|nr:hypothetical protein [Cytophagales bacterium]